MLNSNQVLVNAVVNILIKSKLFTTLDFNADSKESLDLNRY